MTRLLRDGSKFLKTKGLATDSDLEHTEAGGGFDDADPSAVSEKAIARGKGQCGTLGSGNHFLEIQVVEEICDQAAARTIGLELGGIAVMIHSGSRGLGYQVCDDALRTLRNAPARYGIRLPDRQLACTRSRAPRGSGISAQCAPRPTTPGPIASC